jgi:hypothetical protein
VPSHATTGAPSVLQRRGMLRPHRAYSRQGLDRALALHSVPWPEIRNSTDVRGASWRYGDEQAHGRADRVAAPGGV